MKYVSLQTQQNVCQCRITKPLPTCQHWQHCTEAIEFLEEFLSDFITCSRSGIHCLTSTTFSSHVRHHPVWRTRSEQLPHAPCGTRCLLAAGCNHTKHSSQLQRAHSVCACRIPGSFPLLIRVNGLQLIHSANVSHTCFEKLSNCAVRLAYSCLLVIELARHKLGYTMGKHL